MSKLVHQSYSRVAFQNRVQVQLFQGDTTVLDVASRNYF
jgi:hypothetical protein